MRSDKSSSVKPSNKSTFSHSDAFFRGDELQHSPNVAIEPTPKKILIIDDDPDTVDSLRHLLQTICGAMCVVSNDPYDALEKLSQAKFDFIFIDQLMPGLTGSGVLEFMDKQIDQDPITSEKIGGVQPIPTVLMSGTPFSPYNGLKLKNFKLLRRLNKRYLPSFISKSFSN